ncbi:MAG TPA: zinc-binding dehydrogenase [Gemmatimonadaceae bacterium]|nr:zinc-binding dehydrogenase [Gemmatimonadaceae bacterium]
MRALTISEHGDLDRLQYRTDLPVPEPGPGEVRVRVHSAALNHLDLWIVRGLPGVTIKPPWVMGADGAGVIDRYGGPPPAGAPGEGDAVLINPGLSDRTCEFCRRGEQSMCVRFGLLGEHHPGTFADYVVVPVTNVRRVPAGVTMDQAAAFTLVTLTAWRMVVTRAAVQPDETVLIWGIGGGVALAALAIAKLRGARVWVTSSDDSKLSRAHELGADEAFNHSTTDIAKEIRARTGKRGVDVVLDNVGAATWKQSLGALAKGGRLVTSGGTSGPAVETDVRKLFWNQWTILGSTMGSDAELDAIVAELAAGRLRVPIDSVFPLAEGHQALEHLQKAEQFGKVVLRLVDQPL